MKNKHKNTSSILSKYYVFELLDNSTLIVQATILIFTFFLFFYTPASHFSTVTLVYFITVILDNLITGVLFGLGSII